ncbi:hypothetical protein NEIPOLOT_01543, partial [Neisseria polysaccharea ATCC 43768]
ATNDIPCAMHASGRVILEEDAGVQGMRYTHYEDFNVLVKNRYLVFLNYLSGGKTATFAVLLFLRVGICSCSRCQLMRIGCKVLWEICPEEFMVW